MYSYYCPNLLFIILKQVFVVDSWHDSLFSRPAWPTLTMTEENPSTKVFRDYIRIPSVQPDPDYYEAVEFLVNQAKSLGLPYNTHECCPGKPILIITWEGTDPSLASVILNSHMDVVPVFPEHWTYEPFSAFKVGFYQSQSWEKLSYRKDESGNIYGRGSQDMKSVGIQHLEAVRRLKAGGVRLRRTIHITYVPDEGNTK